MGAGVSIIIPIYNVESYLKECLDSVVGQTFEDLDIIVVDDGSTDNSLAIALEYAKKDKRIFVVTKPNGGQSSARNVGLEMMVGTQLREYITKDKNIAFGRVKTFLHTHSFDHRMQELDIAKELPFQRVAHNFVEIQCENINEYIIQELPDRYVHFLDGDDWLSKDCIQRCIDEAMARQVDICAHNLVRYFQNEDRLSHEHRFDIPNRLKKFYYKNAIEAVVDSKTYSFVFSVQGIFRAKLLNSYHLRYIHGIYNEDNDFAIILFSLSKKFLFLDFAGYFYRIHSASSTSLESISLAQMPVYLKGIYPFFKDYKKTKIYYHCYCVAKSGVCIENFFKDCQKTKKEEVIKYKSYFRNSLPWHCDILRVPLNVDPLGILELIQKECKNKVLLFCYSMRQIFRHPKKIKNLVNLIYLLKN